MSSRQEREHRCAGGAAGYPARRAEASEGPAGEDPEARGRGPEFLQGRQPLGSGSRGSLARAARRSGFAVMSFAGVGPGGFGKRLRPEGVDFVDVAPLGIDDHPFAVVALGLDCSLHFLRDPMGGGATKTLRCGDVDERAYRVLCAEGHVFLLTNKRLYVFADLASRFLVGEVIDGLTPVRSLDLEAVDASLAPDGSLLVVMPDSVYRMRTSSIVEQGTPAGQLRPSLQGEPSWESSAGLPGSSRRSRNWHTPKPRPPVTGSRSARCSRRPGRRSSSGWPRAARPCRPPASGR